MDAVRFIIVVLLILVILVAYNPQAREIVMETWEPIRPALVELMDNLYAAIRNLIAGNQSDDQIDNEPGPPSPNFDRIVTMK
jgi:hypothetical protein